MRSFQTKLLAQLETIATNEDENLELVQLQVAANVGRLLVQHPSNFSTLVTVKYDFQPGKCTINFNEAQGTAPSPNSFYFDTTDDAKISRMLARYATLLRNALDRRAA
jgi:hypothetical protein